MAYFVGNYWGPRQESRQACAERLSTFLLAMKQQDVVFSQWFKKSASRKSPLVLIPSDQEGLQPLLRVIRADIGGAVFTELGFQFSGWTGREASVTASLDMTCGAYNPAVRNSIVVSFDPAAAPTPELLQGILKAAVATFDPEVGIVNTTERLSAYMPSPAWKVPALFRYGRDSGFMVD